MLQLGLQMGAFSQDLSSCVASFIAKIHYRLSNLCSNQNQVQDIVIAMWALVALGNA
jgi:hypothetical protein